MSQQPSVGRIVHYRSYGTPGGEYQPACRAAVITEVLSLEDQGITQAMLDNRETLEMLPAQPVVSLAVLNPDGLYFDQGLSYDEDAALGGTWHWPEYVPGYDAPHEHTLPAGGVRTGGIVREPRTPGPDVP